MPTNAVLSLRRVRQRPWMANLFAAEDLLVSSGAALWNIERASGPAARLTSLHELGERLGQRLGLRHYDIVEEHERADHLVVFVNDSNDLHVLDGLRVPVDELAARRTLVQTECWPVDIVNSERLIGSVYGRFDDVFMTIESSVEPLSRLHPRVHSLLQFADVTAQPEATRFDRPIDVLNYGRRDAAQHGLLEHWAAGEPERWYQFDTFTDMRTGEPRVHRRAMGQLLANSRVSVCNYAAFPIPERTAGAREAGPRFFEGLAGGCAMLGALPTAPLFLAASAEWPGLISMSLDDEALPREFDEFMHDEAHRSAVASAHRRAALLGHDHAHRLTEMFERLGVPVPSGVTDRVDQLAGLVSE